MPKKPPKIGIISQKVSYGFIKPRTKVCESFLAPKFPESLFLIDQFLIKKVYIKFIQAPRLPYLFDNPFHGCFKAKKYTSYKASV